MLTDESINFVHKGVHGVPLVWVIDGECLYDKALDQDIADIFLSADEVVDISSEYPDHDGITIKLLKNGEVLEEFQTSEYFGSILLSNPLVLDLAKYPYGKYVMSPNAKFDGEKFIITNRDVSNLEP